MRNDQSLITSWRASTSFLRATSSIIVFFFLWMNVHPAIAAAKDVVKDPATVLGKPSQPAPAKDLLNDALKQVSATLTGLDKNLAAKTPDLKALTEQKGRLKTLRSALADADTDLIAAFAQDLAHIEKHKLPDVIKQRHANAVTEYQARHKQMLGYLDGLVSSNDAAALKSKVKAARDWLGQQQLEPKPAPFDPNKLGFQVETKKARAPKLTTKELKQILPATVPLKTSLLDAGIPIQVASSGSMSGLLAMSAVTPPGAEYLTPTTDIQITPEIQALAAQLHNNPVEIYNWVRNNVEWIPTYGSVQGSAMTLDKKAGNAFDTASLLMALLRASNIPARYVYGTIQVPIAQAMNWAGGFTHPDAAQTFLATGGIPNNALTSGGVTKYIRMEHIWVEAFVDFYPSRGVRNVAPDTWVPMDASFKQYSYTDGLDLRAGAPFDAEGFLTEAQEGATVNESEGWVQNLNQANIQTRLTQYQQQLQDFIESQNPDATVGEVLGAKTIQPINAPVLAASLPYQLIATGNRYSALPDSLRHKFQYSLYANSHERAIENPLWTYIESTPNLAGKKVTLSFVPASDADRQTIESYLPKPHDDGSPIQPEEFPSSLPAYNIRVTAELRVEGDVVARGGTFTLGTELLGEGGFTYLHNLNDWDLTQDQHVAGQSSALGISLQGISPDQLTALKYRLESTKTKLEANDVAGLTGEQVSGDSLTVTVWSYFTAVESFGRIAQRQAGTVDNPGLTYGFFHAKVTPEYRYGLVHRTKFPGVLMDIGHLRRIAYDKNNSLADWVNYNRFRGQNASAMEHAIPEHFFTDQDHPGEGVSAVKTLAVAASQGQKIYTLTQANQSQLSNIQHSAGVMENIRSAIAAGKEVTIHERSVSVAGFIGAGYTVIDPQTGAGAYLIEGGANGGLIFVNFLLFGVSIFFALTSLSVLSIIVLAFTLYSLNGFLDSLENISQLESDEARLDALNDITILNFISTAIRASALKKFIGPAGRAEAAALYLLLEAFIKGIEHYFTQ